MDSKPDKFLIIPTDGNVAELNGSIGHLKREKSDIDFSVLNISVENLFEYCKQLDRAAGKCDVLWFSNSKFSTLEYFNLLFASFDGCNPIVLNGKNLIGELKLNQIKDIRSAEGFLIPAPLLGDNPLERVYVSEYLDVFKCWSKKLILDGGKILTVHENERLDG